MATDTPEPVEQDPPQALMPKWVPPMIGIVLVALAGLAVYTGVAYRRDTLAGGIVRVPRTQPHSQPGNGAPGEPGPGGSLVFPGDTGDNAPTASAPVSGHAHTELTGGGAGGIVTTNRLWARRGMMMTITPDDAMIYVNDLPVGEAKQFHGQDQVYDFPQPGSYTVRVEAPGYKPERFIITASDTAKQEVAGIKLALVKG